MDLQDSRSNARYAVAAGFLGWTLDAFDFFVVVFVLSAVAKNFGRSIPALALTLTITVMASISVRPERRPPRTALGRWRIAWPPPGPAARPHRDRPKTTAERQLRRVLRARASPPARGARRSTAARPAAASAASAPPSDARA